MCRQKLVMFDQKKSTQRIEKITTHKKKEEERRKNNCIIFLLSVCVYIVK